MHISTLTNFVMSSSFPLALRIARRASGLTQSDCAFLLGSHRSKVSHLECGVTVPTLRDACALSLIYDIPLESLFDGLVEEICADVRTRVAAVPNAPTGWRGGLNRQKTLSRLRDELEALTAPSHEAA